ncbi:MAG: glutamate formimidoyltransferase [Bacteroidota bacterium]|jgi:glutamate formiminotransferase/formiminotetrahydrofolate cyclodeaminase
MQIIECVPNFSEGNDPEILRQICDCIAATEGVMLLNTDPGKATNRTVVTFAGPPQQVIDAAFAGIKMAAALIDMSKHKGEHPRMGATDVCPLIPVSGISMEETAAWAVKLAKRVGEELGIAVYLYEAAQTKPERKNLSIIREGEYEGFFEKIKKPEWKPDFGPAVHHPKHGSTVIGARDFLIAYNVNLNTTSVRRANSVAFDVREAGRVKREGNPVTGKIVNDAQGNPVSVPGELKAVKGIGWFIKEYGIAQVSMNLTNMHVTPIHMAFEACCRSAERRGMRVTGSELVGLIPLQCMLDAGKYFLQKQQRSLGVSHEELIHIAVKSMGLDELSPFHPKERIIEYAMEKHAPAGLVEMSVKAFAMETASESPAPGGGSVAALCGVMGASLATMVANLSSHKKGWDDRWEEFSKDAEKGQALIQELLFLVDEDTRSFNRIMDAMGLPKKTEAEQAARKRAMQEATLYAASVPLRVMETAYKAYALAEAMITRGNPNSVTDAGVGALCLHTCIMGAWLNVQINLKGVENASQRDEVFARGKTLSEESTVQSVKLWQLTEKVLKA